MLQGASSVSLEVAFEATFGGFEVLLVVVVVGFGFGLDGSIVFPDSISDFAASPSPLPLLPLLFYTRVLQMSLIILRGSRLGLGLVWSLIRGFWSTTDTGVAVRARGFVERCYSVTAIAIVVMPWVGWCGGGVVMRRGAELCDAV